jgi:hypothetical protein
MSLNGRVVKHQFFNCATIELPPLPSLRNCPPFKRISTEGFCIPRLDAQSKLGKDKAVIMFDRREGEVRLPTVALRSQVHKSGERTVDVLLSLAKIQTRHRSSPEA